MERPPGWVSGDWRLCRGRDCVGRQLLQHHAQVYPIMNFQLIGVNHQTAPVEVRERLAITESRLPEALKQFAQHPGVEEALILCTCNRVELLAQTKNGSADLRGFLRNYFQIEPSELDKHLYEFHEQDAIRHVFRVTSILDSMVVGEPEILGQV